MTAFRDQKTRFEKIPDRVPAGKSKSANFPVLNNVSYWKAANVIGDELRGYKLNFFVINVKP